jgi:hypothetical protein
MSAEFAASTVKKMLSAQWVRCYLHICRIYVIPFIAFQLVNSMTDAASQRKRTWKAAIIHALLTLVCLWQMHPASGQEPSRGDIIYPRPYDTLKDILFQTHAIVRGTVSDVYNIYDDCKGPQTVLKFRNVITLLGEKHEPDFELRTFGGWLPNGNHASISDEPGFVLGDDHIFFLRNTDWRFSPIIAGLAFRLQKFGEQEVLIDTDGFAVSGVSEVGIEVNAGPLTKAVGLDIQGTDDSKATQSDGIERAVKCEGKSCPVTTADVEAKREREAAAKSGLFSRPDAVEAGPEALRRAISAESLISQISKIAEQHGIRIGGYFASDPKIGCWTSIHTEKPR